MTSKGALRPVTLVLTALWLLWLGLVILIARFNKYDWADPPILDCDTDAEAAVTLLIWLVWTTTAGLATWFAAAKRSLGKNLDTACLAVALCVSFGSASKYASLLEYNKITATMCEEQSSNLPLNTDAAQAPLGLALR